MTLMEVVVDGDARLTLNDALTAFQANDGLYVPLGELMRTLEFPIVVNSVDGQAKGWFLEAHRSFSLDLAHCRVSVENQTEPLNPAHVAVRDGEIYVHRALIEQWFPMDLRPDFARLQVVVRALEPLPVQQRLERQQRWGGMRSTDSSDSARYPTVDVAYRFWDWPFLDATIETRFDRPASGEHRQASLYKLVGAGDLMKMNARVAFTGRDDDPLSDAFVTLGRRDPSRGLLGPLHASEYAIGDVATPRDPLIADNALGRGFTLSNFPLDQPQEFDRFDLRGQLPLGWDIELYRNNRLIDFQSAGAGDRYDFTGIPLDFGVNRFRLVFYGPQGQIREETLQRVIGPGMVRPGQHLYRLTAVAERDDFEVLTQTNSGERIFAGYDFGVTRFLAFGGGVKSLVLDGVRQDYLSTHANLALPGAFGRLEYASGHNGGDALAAILSTRLLGIDVTAETSRFFDFSSERTRLEQVPGLLLNRSELRLGSYLPHVGPVGMGLGVRFMHNRGTEGEHRQAETRLSLNARSATATHVLETNVFVTDTSVTRRTLQRLLVSTRPGPVSLRGELVQELVPTRYVSNIALSADWTFSERATLRLGANRAPAKDVTTYTAGVSWQSEHAALGANVHTTDEGDVTASLTVSSSLVRDPTRNDWLASSNPRARTGAVAARVYLDENGNGDWDETEPPINGARLRISGRTHETATGANGDTFISGLPAYRTTDVAIDLASIDNPFWLVQEGGRAVVLRPGRTAVIEIPVTPTGSIEGAVFRTSDSGFQPIHNLPVTLLTKRGKPLRTTRSAYDGYYYFDRVPPGSYRLRAGRSSRQQNPKDSLIEIDGRIATMRPIDLLAVDSNRPQPVPFVFNSGERGNMQSGMGRDGGVPADIKRRSDRETDKHATAETTPAKDNSAVRQSSAAGYRTEPWVSSRSENLFTLQLLAVRTEAAAQAYIKEWGVRESAAYFSSVVDGTRWYSVIYGEYRSYAEAAQAVAFLPERLRAADPWIREFGLIQTRITES